jgi:hypothetical protein
MNKVKVVFLMGMSAAFAAPWCAAKVYLRWTHSSLPAAQVLGVSEIVIPWNERVSVLLGQAHEQGYQAYVEAGAAQVRDAVNAAVEAHAAGVILRGDTAEQSTLREKAKEVTKTHPPLKVLVLDSGGKQPEMRGWLVFKKDGILQVSSPTSQPWLDANVAMIRYQKAFAAGAPLYTFAWEEGDPLVNELGPKPADYELAIAEAGAYHADLVLEVHAAQQKGLASGNQNALADWAEVKRYLEFYNRSDGSETGDQARVGVLAEDYQTPYEALNLMARHNIPFRVLKSSEVQGKDLGGFDVLIAFAELSKELAAAINDFAASGGVAVLVKLPGPFTWESAGAGATSGPSTTYRVGKGRVIELHEAIGDPETFAQDVRRLMAQTNVPVSLWNSLTTLVAAYRGTKAGETVVELVNYDQELSEVQVQVKGTFRSASYETPERAESEKLKTTQVNGFVQFVVPDLVVGGRVRLE